MTAGRQRTKVPSTDMFFTNGHKNSIHDVATNLSMLDLLVILWVISWQLAVKRGLALARQGLFRLNILVKLTGFP